MSTLTAVKKIENKSTRAVINALKSEFKNVEAYTLPGLRVLRVRIVDDSFKDEDITRREARVFSRLDALPDEIRADLSFLLMATRDELKKSKASLNEEFENPSLN
jgi:hypothetical protein